MFLFEKHNICYGLRWRSKLGRQWADILRILLLKHCGISGFYFYSRFLRSTTQGLIHRDLIKKKNYNYITGFKFWLSLYSPALPLRNNFYLTHRSRLIFIILSVDLFPALILLTPWPRGTVRTTALVGPHHGEKNRLRFLESLSVLLRTQGTGRIIRSSIF